MGSKNLNKTNNNFIAAFLIIAAAMAAGLFLRYTQLDFKSSDYIYFLSKWFNRLLEIDGAGRFGLDYGDYHPSYMYVLAFLTYIPVNSLYSIKAFSIVFDIVCAAVTYKIVEKLTSDKLRSALAYAVVFLLPTAVINSAAWAQCDSVYTAFLLLTVWSMINDRPWRSCIYFGIAFVFKLQAIFLAPVFLIWLIKKKVKIYHLFAVPAVYILSIIPAVICGRSFKSSMLVYLNQTGTYNDLSANAPSIWGFLNHRVNDALVYVGIIIAAAAVLGSAAYICTRTPELSAESIADMSVLIVLLVPFFLPKMHERYFYAADIMSIYYAVLHPKRFYIPLLISAASLVSYMRFLLKLFHPGEWLLTLMMGAALACVAVYFVKDYCSAKKSVDKCADR